MKEAEELQEDKVIAYLWESQNVFSKESLANVVDGEEFPDATSQTQGVQILLTELLHVEPNGEVWRGISWESKQAGSLIGYLTIHSLEFFISTLNRVHNIHSY